MSLFEFLKLETHSGEVYYSSEANRFFQVRGIHNDRMVCGNFAEYFEDAKTTKPGLAFSYQYLSKCQKVDAIDQLEATYYDGYGWRVKKTTPEK